MWILEALERKQQDEEAAIIYRNNYISWKDLWKKSELLSVFLDNCLKTKKPVIIYGNKDIEINISMLAILKSGRAYVPVDITYPKGRLRQIVEMTSSELIINFSDADVSDLGCNVLNKSELLTCFEHTEPCVSDRQKWVKTQDVCYILFTSGSTGQPKGVQITKGNIESFVSSFEDPCKLESGSIALNQVSYSFDVSVIQLYIYLSQGVTLFNIDKEMMENLGELFNALENSNIAVWVSTPALLELCNSDIHFGRQLLPKLEKIILAGEVLTKALVTSIKRKFNNIEIINGYGPTEGTVLLSACSITDKMIEDNKSLPIGEVFSTVSYRVENANRTPCAPGEKGELVVVGENISNGYFNDLEKSEEVFFSENGINGYRTGDLVFEENGLLYFSGRIDSQIKLNGFRIELNDISNNISKIDFTINNIIVPIEKDERVEYLAAFVILNKQAVSIKRPAIEIKKKLRSVIPAYMVPKKIIIIDSFPMNASGKIDRKKLIKEFL